MTRFVLALLVGLCVQAAAVAQTIVVPAEVEPYRLVPAKLDMEIPEGAYLSDGGWEVMGATPKQVPDVRLQGAELFFTGRPGVYTVSYDGVLLRDVTIPVGEGKTEKVPVYMRKVRCSAKVTIKGGGVDPDPDPPPDPPSGKYQIVLFWTADQLDEMTQGQREVLNSLDFRDWIAQQGHVFLDSVDPAAYGGNAPKDRVVFVTAIKGDPLPRIAVADAIAGGPVFDAILPDGIEAAKAWLADPALKGKVAKQR